MPVAFDASHLRVPSGRLRLCSDEQLVARFRAGRDEAFDVIHDRYRARLLAYVRSMLPGRSAEDAEDVLQDVFERAARTLRAESPVGLRAWLYSVAHNRCIDELRRRPPASPDVLAASRTPPQDTGAVAERRADVRRLFDDLRLLPELQRSALLMRELQGLSHVELAAALDATVPAVKSLLVRARVGLVDAAEARGATCASIRDDLAATHDRHVKTSARAARHLLECTSCRSFRTELRRTTRRVAALAPAPALLPLAALGRLLGGGGVSAKAPATASGVAGTGGLFAGGGKLFALLGATTVLTTGAVLDHNGALSGRSAAGGQRDARMLPARSLEHRASAGSRPAGASAGQLAIRAQHSVAVAGAASPAGAETLPGDDAPQLAVRPIAAAAPTPPPPATAEAGEVPPVAGTPAAAVAAPSAGGDPQTSAGAPTQPAQPGAPTPTPTTAAGDAQTAAGGDKAPAAGGGGSLVGAVVGAPVAVTRATLGVAGQVASGLSGGGNATSAGSDPGSSDSSADGGSSSGSPAATPTPKHPVAALVGKLAGQ